MNSPVDGPLVLFASMCFKRKITIVTSKGQWASDDDFTHMDVVIAYYAGQFMVTKVGKCCEKNFFFFLIFVEMSCATFSNFFTT